MVEGMEIKDIIKTDSDRLFVVDPECYIIYTGDSIDDEKPFIRIGNWSGMPAMLIPLIENIVITDAITGNPFIEQFNIDLTTLPSNRFIGSRHIVQRYLSFQKNFDLDLTNASIVDVEKDIPELSREKNISSRNQYIGVFYRDGNFRTLHNSKPIIDLNELEKETFGYAHIHDLISEQAKKSDRYSGAGIIPLDSGLMFYSQKSFVSYLLPQEYFQTFSSLSIDPARISAFIFPSSNFMFLSRMLIWKNRREGKIKLYSDSTETVQSAKKLFSACTLSSENFTGFTSNDLEGVQIKNIPGSYNLKIKYKRLSGAPDEFKAAYIQDASMAKDALAEKCGAIFVSYTAYEKANLIFRSASVPVCVIDDGNSNISKIKDSETCILRKNIQYEFQVHDQVEGLIGLSEADDELISIIKSCEKGDIKKIMRVIRNEESHGDPRIKSFNTISLIRLIINCTNDRGLSTSLKSALRELKREINMDELLKSAYGYKIVLAFFDGKVFEFMKHCENINADIFLDSPDSHFPQSSSKGQIKFFERIKDDRDRLEKLLSMYLSDSKIISSRQDEIKKISEAVEKRKSGFTSASLFITGLMEKNSGSNGKIKLKSAIPAAVIIAAIIILLISWKWKTATESGKSTEKVSILEISENDLAKAESSLSSRYGIKISERDIYEYADAVALKNGYTRIVLNAIKQNNPHWIYPGNVFILLDGEKVLVKSGDTLWGIAKRKLVELNTKFYESMENIEKASPAEKLRRIDTAKKYAFSKKHFEMLKGTEPVADGTGKK